MDLTQAAEQYVADVIRTHAEENGIAVNGTLQQHDLDTLIAQANAAAEAYADAYVGLDNKILVPDAVRKAAGTPVAFPGIDGVWTIMTKEELLCEPQEHEVTASDMICLEVKLLCDRSTYRLVGQRLIGAFFLLKSAACEELELHDHRRASRCLAWKMMNRLVFSLNTMISCIVSSLRAVDNLPIRDRAVTEKLGLYVESSKARIQEHVLHISWHVEMDSPFDEHREEIRAYMSKNMERLGMPSGLHGPPFIRCPMCNR